MPLEERDGREITNGTERAVERESYGIGETGRTDDTSRVKGAENKLPAREAYVCRMTMIDAAMNLKHCAVFRGRDESWGDAGIVFVDKDVWDTPGVVL
jgi:hypothetical protein